MPVYRLSPDERETERQQDREDRELAYHEKEKDRLHELNLARIEVEARLQSWDKKLELAEKRRLAAAEVEVIQQRYRAWLLLLKGPALLACVLCLTTLRLFGKDSPALETFLNS